MGQCVAELAQNDESVYCSLLSEAGLHGEVRSPNSFSAVAFAVSRNGIFVNATAVASQRISEFSSGRPDKGFSSFNLNFGPNGWSRSRQRYRNYQFNRPAGWRGPTRVPFNCGRSTPRSIARHLAQNKPHRGDQAPA